MRWLFLLLKQTIENKVLNTNWPSTRTLGGHHSWTRHLCLWFLGLIDLSDYSMSFNKHWNTQQLHMCIQKFRGGQITVNVIVHFNSTLKLFPKSKCTWNLWPACTLLNHYGLCNYFAKKNMNASPAEQDVHFFLPFIWLQFNSADRISSHKQQHKHCQAGTRHYGRATFKEVSWWRVASDR